MRSKLIYVAATLALTACREEPAVSMTPADTPQGVVDSIFPVEEEIRRFKAARNGASATELKNASETRDALVARFIKALEARDSADVRAMVLNAAEFIDLYYPTSVHSQPPYKQSPELTWFLLQQNSEKGIKRALDRYGGVPLNFEGYTCSTEPKVEQANHLWAQCTVRWAPAVGAPSPMRLFGSIIERDGRFKFVSYANDL